MANPLNAVVFDLGDCLWFQAHSPADETVFALEADSVRPLFHRWAIEPPGRLDLLIAEIWSAMEEAYAAGIERGTYREPSMPFLWQGALAQHDIEVSDWQAEQLWRTGWMPARQFGLQLYPDAIDVLRELKARGFRIGVCSNRPCTEDMLRPDLADFGLARYVDAVTCSGDTGYFKPHRAPFERVLASLRVEPGAALMVGDGASSDVLGGKAIGMRTAWKLNGRYGLPATPDADVTIHDLNELLDLPLLGGAGAAHPASPTPHEDDNEDRF